MPVDKKQIKNNLIKPVDVTPDTTLNAIDDILDIPEENIDISSNTSNVADTIIDHTDYEIERIDMLPRTTPTTSSFTLYEHKSSRRGVTISIGGKVIQE